MVLPGMVGRILFPSIFIKIAIFKRNNFFLYEIFKMKLDAVIQMNVNYYAVMKVVVLTLLIRNW